jgi:hypothetical protein
MDIVGLLVFLLVIGLVWWVVNRFIPLPPMAKNVFTVVIVIIVAIYLLQWAGLTSFGARDLD